MPHVRFVKETRWTNFKTELWSLKTDVVYFDIIAKFNLSSVTLKYLGEDTIITAAYVNITGDINDWRKEARVMGRFIAVAPLPQTSLGKTTIKIVTSMNHRENKIDIFVFLTISAVSGVISLLNYCAVY